MLTEAPAVALHLIWGSTDMIGERFRLHKLSPIIGARPPMMI